MTWNTPRSTITSTRFGASLDLRTLSTRNVIERPAAFADAFAFLIALAEMSVATTSKPRFARFIACVAGPVPRSRIRTPRRRCAFRARSMSVSRAGLYQGSVATSGGAYTLSPSPVGSRGRSDPADLEGPAGRRAESALVIAQAELGLRNANRQTVQARIFEPFEIVQGCGVVLHIGRTIDGRGDFRDLLLEGIVVLVDEPNPMSRGVGRFEDKPREGFAARAAIPVAGVGRRANAQVLDMLHDGVDLSVRVGGEAIHRDDGRHAEGLQDFQMRVEVREASMEGLQVFEGEVFLLYAAVVLQRAHAHDEDRGVRSQAALAAHEVHELLATQVGAESRFRDDEVPEAEGEPVRQDAAVPGRDVRERPAVDERGRALERLDEVRHERVLQQDRGGPVHVEIAHAHGMLAAIECDDDPFEAGLEIAGPLRPAEERHPLAGGPDGETVLPRDALPRAAAAPGDVAPP